MSQSNKAIWAALASNAAIMISKFIGAALGGSASLLAEALHSVADTADSGMLLLGKHRAAKPADDLHPFGHGKELYFWTLVVAVSIFTIGGVASIFEGIDRIAHPPPPESPLPSYIVLGLAVLFEGSSMIFAWRQFLQEKGKDRGIWEGIRKAKDPTTFLVVFEDTAAVLGVLIALTAIWLQYQLSKPWIDGVGALCVGLLMASVAIFLIYEVRALLVGERLVPQEEEKIRELLNHDDTVTAIQSLRSLHFGPETVVVTIEAQFKSDLTCQDLAAAVNRLAGDIQSHHTSVKYVYIQPTLATAAND